MKQKLLIIFVLFAISLPVAAQSKLTAPDWGIVSYFQPRGKLEDGRIGRQKNWCVHLSWGLVNNAAGYKVMMRRTSGQGGGKPTYVGVMQRLGLRSGWGGSNSWVDSTAWSDDANANGPFNWCGLAGNQTVIVRVRAYDAQYNDGRMSRKIKVHLPAIGHYLCSLQHQCIVFEKPGVRKRGYGDLFQPAND